MAGFRRIPSQRIRQSRMLEIVSGSKPHSLAASATRRVENIPAAPCSGLFPLTPALSLRERVNPAPREQQSKALGFPLREARCSLSLRGVRVRGNGANARLAVSDHSRNCLSGRVLRRNRRFPQRLRRDRNDEFRMPNTERMTKHEIRIQCPSRPFFGFWISDFFRHLSFVIRHCAALS